MRTLQEKIDSLRAEGWIETQCAAVFTGTRKFPGGMAGVKIILADGRVANAFTDPRESVQMPGQKKEDHESH